MQIKINRTIQYKKADIYAVLCVDFSKFVFILHKRAFKMLI